MRKVWNFFGTDMENTPILLKISSSPAKKYIVFEKFRASIQNLVIFCLNMWYFMGNLNTFSKIFCYFLGKGGGGIFIEHVGGGASSAITNVVVLKNNQQWPPIPNTMSKKIEILYFIFQAQSYWKNNPWFFFWFFFPISRSLPTYLYFWTTFQKVSYYQK